MSMINSLDFNLLRYVPSRLRSHLESCYRDSDGYWFHFDELVIDQATGSHTIHEDTILDCRSAFRYAVISRGLKS